MAELQASSKAASKGTGVVPGAAGARRATRAMQARWLSSSMEPVASHTTLTAIAWDDLGQLPDWVFAGPEAIDRLVVHVGAWVHAAALRQCIDGRVLAAVRGRSGDAAFAAVMEVSDEVSADVSAEAVVTAPSFTEGASVEAVLEAMDVRARAVLLGSIAHGALREAVRERLWPDAPPLLRPDPVAPAQALVAKAWQQLGIGIDNAGVQP